MNPNEKCNYQKKKEDMNKLKGCWIMLFGIRKERREFVFRFLKLIICETTCLPHEERM